MEFTAAAGYDWTHCNGIQLAPDGNLVLSSRHQNWLMKIDYGGGTGSGAILWKLGYQGDFTLVGNATQPTDWFFAQHYPNLLSASRRPDHEPLVFDNGNDRCYATPGGCAATSPPPPPPFSRGAIFQIDEAALTAQLAWQYPLNEYSYWGGNVMRLINGDIEICASEPVPIGTTPPSNDVSVPGRRALEDRAGPGDRLADDGRARVAPTARTGSRACIPGRTWRRVTGAYLEVQVATARARRCRPRRRGALRRVTGFRR